MTFVLFFVFFAGCAAIVYVGVLAALAVVSKVRQARNFRRGMKNLREQFRRSNLEIKDDEDTEPEWLAAASVRRHEKDVARFRSIWEKSAPVGPSDHTPVVAFIPASPEPEQRHTTQPIVLRPIRKTTLPQGHGTGKP